MHRVANTCLDRQVAGHHGSEGPGSVLEGCPGAGARRATIWIDRVMAGPAVGAMPVGEAPQRTRLAALSIPRPMPVARPETESADARWIGAPRPDAAHPGPADLAPIAAFDALAQAAIVCDPAGRILAASRHAGTILAAGESLARAGDRLVVPDAHGQARLRAAIIHCATAAESGIAAGNGERQTLALAGPDAIPIRIDVASLPAVDGHGRCVVTVTGNRPGPRAIDQLVGAFGLTRAEAEVAIDLAHGLSAREVAERRSASSDTVRKQTQAIFQKLGVAKATRLAFVLGPFLR